MESRLFEFRIIQGASNFTCDFIFLEILARKLLIKLSID